jgi:hypothetical protein
MPLSTRFFPVFGSLLCGSAPLSGIAKLLRDEARPHSLSAYQESFGRFIPATLWPTPKKGPNSRQRAFTPAVTFWAFLAQVLERGSSCRDALARVQAWQQQVTPEAPPPLASGTAGYCMARRRLDDTLLGRIATHLGTQLHGQVLSHEHWRGRRVSLVDGTSASMPDTAENQLEWPQPTGQSPGSGFPVVRLVALVCQGSGALRALEASALGQGESQLARKLWPQLERGEVVVADRGFGSYHHLAAIRAQGAEAVMRLHAARQTDFARQGQTLGPDEWLVTWPRPEKPAGGVTAEEHLALPASLTLRVVRYRVTTPGFRTEEVTLVTTLCDPAKDPAEALAALYRQRWQVELHFREIKTLLGLDVLRCQTPEMVRKEILLHQVAYNLVRLLMQQAAHLHDVPLRRLSFKGTVDRLPHFADAIQALRGRKQRQARLLDELLLGIAKDLLPERPDRVEPRAKKRRPKSYQLLCGHRHDAKIPPHRNRPAKKKQTPLN